MGTLIIYNYYNKLILLSVITVLSVINKVNFLVKY